VCRTFEKASKPNSPAMCDCEFDTDRLDFELDDTKWKAVFSKLGGLAAGCSCLSPRVYLAMRVSMFLTWFLCVVWSNLDWISGGTDYKYYWIHLTHWSAALQLLYLGFAAATTYMAVHSNVPDGMGASTPWFVSVTWLLSSMVPVIALMVAVLFWVLVYEPGPGKPSTMDVVMHGANFALALLDLLLTRQPFYIEHVYTPLMFSMSYILFTIVYYWLGGKNKNGVDPYIYESVDWSKPHETGRLLGVVVFLGVPLMYAALFLVVACRKKARQAAAARAGQQVPEGRILLVGR